jgi:antibiotic biosynthesis monooxygenase (ABM) superfamily enzyme
MRANLFLPKETKQLELALNNDLTLTASAPRPAGPVLQPPSVHVRAVVTWLAVFPLVAVGLMVLAPLSEGWHPVLRALVLTAVVAPIAVYLLVPRLLAGHGALLRHRDTRKPSR